MDRKYALIFVFFIGFCFQTVQATNPISVEAYEESFIPKVKKAGFWSKVKIAYHKAADVVKEKKFGVASFILGLLSLIGLFIILPASTGAWLLLVVAGLALAADILAIRVLLKTRKDRKAHRAARIYAVLGLITGLLTGLLPLALLIIVLISL